MPRRRSAELLKPGAFGCGLVLAALLAGCTSRPFDVEPPADAKRSAALQATTVVGQHDYDPNPHPISFCYSSQLNTRQEVMARARESCPNNGSLRFQDEDFLFNGCALFQPNRVTFICTPGPRPDSPYD